MSFSDLLACFHTGSLSVIRRVNVPLLFGRRQAPSESTIELENASIEPISGTIGSSGGVMMVIQPDGFHPNTTYKIYTTTELKTVGGGYAADRIEIYGELYEIFKVQRFDGIDAEPHYEALAARLVMDET